MREIIEKAKFFIDRVRYKKGKNFYAAAVVLLFIIMVIFSVIYINLKLEIKRKENILKSYYSGSNVAGDNAGGEGEAAAEPGGRDKNLSDGNGNYSDSIENDGSNNQQLEDTIKAYICGEVKNSGVYELDKGLRIIDLINIAGGKSENACLEIVNLALVLVDGQRVYIPSRDEVEAGDSLFFNGSYPGEYDVSGNQKVDINTAGLRELESLPGIGPVIAANIIDYRERNGLFKKKEELKKVTGIGEKKYDRIIGFISI
ncbi:MAG: helix-hairpin-helix domain-containing protein [Actinomycetota bacterium]|nr:helix-hairpin-helix domain-containing protein [Actinomycetota bacterium]